MRGEPRGMVLSWVVAAVFLLVVGIGREVWSQTDEGTEVEYAEGIDLGEYQRVEQRPQQTSWSAPLLVSLAYGLMWMGLMLFVWMTWRRAKILASDLGEARDRLKDLEARITERGKGGEK